VGALDGYKKSGIGIYDKGRAQDPPLLLMLYPQMTQISQISRNGSVKSVQSADECIRSPFYSARRPILPCQRLAM
jgi:hypothetical protein